MMAKEKSEVEGCIYCGKQHGQFEICPDGPPPRQDHNENWKKELSEAAERLQNHLQYVLFTDTSPASYAALADWNLIYMEITSDDT